MVAVYRVQGSAVINTIAWEHVNVKPGNRVIGRQALVDQKAPNTRACMRMCWLYTACSALTYTLNERKCQLYQAHGDRNVFNTVYSDGSLAVDMKTAKVAPTKRKIGCHTRPCKKTELCAPVKNAAHYVCIPLITGRLEEDIPVVPNSKALYDGISSVLYTCAHGYFRRGNSYVSTYEHSTGTWSTVDVSCYNLPDGASYISQCESDGTWSSTANFRCSPVDCGTLSPVANARFLNYTGTTFGENVTVICLPGFSPQAGLTFTCDESGNWFGNDATCDLVDCGNPPTVENSVAHQDTSILNSECSQDGTWSGSQVQCLEWNCDPPPDLKDGTVHFTSLSLNSTATYTCSAGLGFSEISSSISNQGSGVSDSVTFSQSVDIVCNDERLWVSRITQKPSETLACEQVECPTAPVIPNAKVAGNSAGSFTVNATLRYECLDEFKHRGLDSEIKCGEDGTWGFPFFECLKIDCGFPQATQNASVNVGSGTTAGSKAVFTCDAGYQHVSSHSTRTCGSDGLWSREYIECVPYEQKHCGDPPPIADATFEVYSSQGEWAAVYTCVKGYQHSWSNSYDCSPQLLYWIAGPVVECVPVDCGPPPPVQHADSVFTATTFGSVVTYQCNAGYTSSGSNTKQCTSEGTWSAEPVIECNVPGAVTCGHPPEVANSVKTYTSILKGSVASYTCDNGFVANTFMALCGASGQWELQEPYGCSPIACGNVPTVQHSAPPLLSGTTYGQVARYECLAGFKHTGTSLKTCEANGTWSDDIVECVPENSISCSDPPKRHHATVSFESRAEGAKATYSCTAGGYTGQAVDSHCGNNGQWLGLQVMCEPVNCRQAPYFKPNAVIPFWFAPQILPFGRSLAYSCYPGLTSSTGAPLISTCNEDGTWLRPTGYCEFLQKQVGQVCNDTPPAVNNAEPISDAAIEVGGVLEYICHAGYVPLPHASVRTCLRGGRWSTDPLVCYPSLCLTTPPPPVDNAIYTGLKTVGRYADAVVGVYTCAAGHTTDNQPPATNASNTSFTVACSPSTGWPEDVPSQNCTPVGCEEAGDFQTSAGCNSSNPSALEVEVTSPSTVDEMTTPDSEEASDPVVCDLTDDGLFLFLGAACEVCNQSAAVPHGVITVHFDSEKPYGTEASLRCDANYQLIGHQRFQCGLVNGTVVWKGLAESRCVQNRWQDIPDGEKFYRFDLHMDAVTSGFSACANLTYTDQSKQLQLSVQDYRNGQYDTVALVIGGNSGTSFRRQLKLPGKYATMVELDKVVFAPGQTAYVCIVLDMSTMEFTFINNLLAEMTMEAPAFDDLEVFKIGNYVTVNEVVIVYNELIGKDQQIGMQSVGFTADDWLTGPVSPSAILDFLRYVLRPPERARGA
ncbi:sushi, von Willebrand factor type A, EGF and pentraxin domain-containing protein 1 [Elysia marginata]|uniref:Sushi, von Willebrand factor type A, EGF and pentraxin domain-containing protein 1 n=1 Tax=Elysia marginata TaxID=1093978 RepID=A0AAV4FMP8_9GAST|nr:sushi, von Willebrand factor type A, EGF and pentraxin domain-containing protein 1 [Elysia marginata]